MADPSRIVEIACAFYDSCVLFAACDVGVFAALAGRGPSDGPALAGELGLDERAARLLLDACVAVGLLEKEDGRYRNSPESEAFLAPGAPADLSGALRYNRRVYSVWAGLAEFARTGRPVERPELHLGEDRERTREFVAAMHNRALGIGRAVVPLLDLTGCRRLLDVGGGPGTYSALIARANPQIACIVLDLPPVLEVAAELIEEQGMTGRVELLPGDYHVTEFPAGNDAVIFFGVLHQETPEAIAGLLEKACAALAPGGRLYVMDMFTDSTRAAPKFSALFAVNMALTTEHGWVFSADDVRGWMEGAGLEEFSVRPLPPPMPHWLAAARKPG